jgi:hypothetical protein
MKNNDSKFNQKPVPLILILSKESYYVEAPAQQVLEETAMKYEKAPNTEVRINP